ncbi:MAG: sugar transferase [Deltaproteobacteria bacterium]|nr:sugar transferase [Deltaproteobacteria bacterium]
MVPFRRKILLDALQLFDLAALVGYFLFAAWVNSREMKGVSFEQVLTMRIRVSNLLIFLGLLLVWHLIFVFFKLYHSRRLTSIPEDALQIIKAFVLGTLVLFLGELVFDIRLINGLFLVVFSVTGAAGTMASRVALKKALEKVRTRGRNLRNILIVGTNPRALRLVNRIQKKPEFGYKLLGFVDEGTGMKGFEKSGHHLVADFNTLPDLLRSVTVDEVVICLPIKSFYQQISQIVADCERQGILVRFLSDIFNLKLGRIKPEEFDEGAFITVSTGRMEGLPVLVKYGLDFVVSLALLVLLSPLFLVVALLIKCTSPGPVFFVQDRVGLHKRVFRLYKFRTMVNDAEEKIAALEGLNEVDGPAFKIKNDPRVTGFGKYLRKASLDELPQLINVLKGEMSLVGPRPLPIRDYNGFDRDWHRRRFSVKPGMTCLWQVNGRSNVSFSEWMKMDMEYIDQWSFWLDLKILILTIPAALKGSGAA